MCLFSTQKWTWAWGLGPSPDYTHAYAREMRPLKSQHASASQDSDPTFFHANVDVGMGIRHFTVALGGPYDRGRGPISNGGNDPS